MQAVLYIYYFTTAILSVVFSICILIAQKVLRINRLFFFLGAYFFFLSLIALTHAFILTPLTDAIAGDLMKLERVFGLTAGYFMLFLVRSVREDIISGVKLKLIFIFLGVLLVTAVIDLLFDVGIFFLEAPPKIHVAPLSRIFFIPFSILGLGTLCVFLYRAYTSTVGRNRTLIGTLFYGMLVLLPFEYWDFFNLMLRDDPVTTPFFLYNMGMFIFFLFISVFIIQFIRIQIRYTLHNASTPKYQMSGDDAFLKNIYAALSRKLSKDRLYRNEKFSLTEAASAVNANRNDVSKAVNMFFHDNFSLFVNKFRVDDMIEHLRKPDISLSILEIGIAAGFNSKTSMNRMFYKFVRKTPRQFRSEVLASFRSMDMSGAGSAYVDMDLAQCIIRRNEKDC